MFILRDMSNTSWNICMQTRLWQTSHLPLHTAGKHFEHILGCMSVLDTLVTLTPTKPSRQRCIPYNAALSFKAILWNRLLSAWLQAHCSASPPTEVETSKGSQIECLFEKWQASMCLPHHSNPHTAVPCHPINWACSQGEINSSGNLLPLQAPAKVAYSHKQRVSFFTKTGWARGLHWHMMKSQLVSAVHCQHLLLLHPFAVIRAVEANGSAPIFWFNL